MEVNPRLRLVVLALALSVAALTFASPAGASHIRPKGATPLRDALVIAQKQCTAPNSTHNQPPSPAVSSCTPPVGPLQESAWLTAGTPDVNSAGSQSVGFVRLDVLISPVDVGIQMSLTDVRCLPPTAAAVCANPNTAGTPNDYTGELQLLLGLQITDHFNAPSNTQTGTMIAIPFPVTVPCSTTGVSIGSSCPMTTTMNTLVPGSVVANRRMSLEIPQGVPNGGIQVWDGGMNGVAGSSGSTLFAETGVFVP